MPNHVTNILTIVGDLEEVRRIFGAIAPGSDPEAPEATPEVPLFKPATHANLAKRRENNYEIDFNKIVPTPSDVFQGDLGDAERKKHGRNNWYDWSIDNWGTKWNAYDMTKIDDASMEFRTAWSMPEPVIRALSRKFPDIEVHIKWADEDTGSNCGEIHYLNGEEVYSFIPADSSKEAYELAFEIYGGGEDWKFDEARGTYVYNEDQNESKNVGQMTADLKKIFEGNL